MESGGASAVYRARLRLPVRLADMTTGSAVMIEFPKTLSQAPEQPELGPRSRSRYTLRGPWPHGWPVRRNYIGNPRRYLGGRCAESLARSGVAVRPDFRLDVNLGLNVESSSPDALIPMSRC
jgi:hypothetical protein